MSLKTYTVTVNGTSNGNVIAQPFEVEVHQMSYVDEDGTNPYLAVSVCTKNGGGSACDNDDIPNYNSYSLPAMTSSKNTDLSNTIEADLDAAYGVGNWS